MGEGKDGGGGGENEMQLNLLITSIFAAGLTMSFM